MVYILLGNGFEETEAIAPLDCLRRAGIDACALGISGFKIRSSHQITVMPDRTLDSLTPADVDEAEMIVLPGGLGGVAAIQESVRATALIRHCYEHGKWVAAICAAPTALGALGLLAGKKATVYPGMEDGLTDAIPQPGTPVVVDGQIITGEAAGSAWEFGLTLVSCLRGREAAEKVAEAVHFHETF